MAAYLKPDNINNVWASGGDRIYPGDTKYATGWQVEIPPRQYFNQIDYKQDQFIAHVNQRGIPEWDAITEYQVDKSYIQGSDGTIYRCILTHVNEDPITDVSNTYWEVAFANAGDFYLKSEADALFMQRANNGSDISNVATFRTNISVYSQAQTYTKTEVDAKTTIASTAQAQAWTSNTTLLTPLRLSEAFKGANQLLSTGGGYQKLPGGFIEQWGVATASSSGYVTLTFPIAWPTGMFSIVGTVGGTSVTNICALFNPSTLTTTDIKFAATNSSNSFTSNSIYWRAVGS